MDLQEAIKLDREFLEYFDNVITSIIPKASIEYKQPERLKILEKLFKAMLVGSDAVNKAPPDWVSIIRIAARHYEPENPST